MKNRTLSLAIVFLGLVAAASLVFWAGCSSDRSVAPAVPAQVANDQNVPNASVGEDGPAEDAMLVAMRVQSRHSDEILKINGVVGTGVGVDANGSPVIKILTVGPIASRLPVSIENIPVEMEESGEIVAHALTGTYRPVPIGVSVGNNNECAAGTIGCQLSIGGSTTYCLSNNHVFARQNAAKLGEVIVQPGRYDKQCGASSRIGTLYAFEPIKFGGQTNTYDAAVAKYDAGIAISCATPSSYYGFPGTTPVTGTVGMKVMKVGRTTSQTTGTIDVVNMTVNVGYTGGTATFVGQYYTSKSFDRSGDSGSLVVKNDASHAPVALLFAGNSSGNAVVSPIGPVLSRFKATICGQ